MLRRPFARILLRAAVVAVLGGGFCLPSAATAASATAAAHLPKDKHIVHTDAAAAPIDFPTIAERYGPAVVSISAAPPDQPSSAPALRTIDTDDPFAAFFNRIAPQQPERPEQGSQPMANAPGAVGGTGSGFIISADGLVLSTAHIVDQMEEVTVSLPDRREFKGKVLTVDPQTDVALIKIDATKLPTVKLGDSSRVRVGESVLTVGAPERFEHTVTAGIVTATARTLPDGSKFAFFQTDVSRNPDNSGGPVFNRAGEVIGIDVQIYAGADRATSLAFAIPINEAIEVRTRLQASRNATQSAPGVHVQDVSPGVAVALGLPRPAGALVNAVEPGTLLAARGVKPGDVIVQFGERNVDSAADFVDDMATLPAGADIAVKLIRNRKPMTIRITAAAAAGEAPQSAGSGFGTPQDEAVSGDRLGLIMHALNEDERRMSDLPIGMMVDSVSGPAANAGIRPGDIVLSLNDTLVESPEQAAALETKAGKTVAVLIQRDHVRSFVSIKLR
ncbi:trypsin-like peptidase domain-containing protein [Trinickia fusca]|uniref:Probable periplasmic serine endoprotease DegP-like n=1 Tax=Trinickia fusca TaxID=2419777 RepID=A0A494XV31_9BURK|nr:trypsin-like peptidase domain-containing protein [Trinickia fusca]RKP52806.1 PDZ domain-containing protein [Trinickia fusca]